MNKNNMCDGTHCAKADGEVRLLPVGNTSDHGNMIICHTCYLFEIAYRKRENQRLSKDCQFKTPSWSELKIYEGAS